MRRKPVHDPSSYKTDRLYRAGSGELDNRLADRLTSPGLAVSVSDMGQRVAFGQPGHSLQFFGRSLHHQGGVLRYRHPAAIAGRYGVARFGLWPLDCSLRNTLVY